MSVLEMLSTRLRRLGGCRQGNIVVEFALLMMPLLLMIFGFFELGRYFFLNDSLADAAREAARTAIVRGAASDDPATATEIADIVKAKVPTMVDPAKLTVNVTYRPNNSPGSKVIVQVDYPLGMFLPGMGVLGPFVVSKVAAMTISR